MKTIKYIVSLGIAAGAGMLIGILTAPRKGKLTRSNLIEELDNTKDAFELAANKKLEEAKKIVKKAAIEQQNSGKKAVNKLKEMVTP